MHPSGGAPAGGAQPARAMSPPLGQGALGEAVARLALVAGAPGSRARLIERAPRGRGEVELCGEVDGALAIRCTLGLTEPPKPPEHLVASGGARQGSLRGLRGVQAQASAPTRRWRAVAWSPGQGQDALERWPGLLPDQGGPHPQECPAMGARPECRGERQGASQRLRAVGGSWAPPGARLGHAGRVCGQLLCP